MEIVEKQRILITGGSGMLGFNIVRLLASDPNIHIVLPLRTPHPSLFQQYPQVRIVQADLSDARQMSRLVADLVPHVIVHCAASGVRPARPTWFEMINFNVEVTLRLFEASCTLADCHFIYISTGLVYRTQNRPLLETDPVDTLHPYGASKAAAECLLRAGATEFDRHLTVLRPFSFTGLHDGGGRLFPSLLRAALANQPVRLSPGTQYRDFSCVQDIASAVAAILRRKRKKAIEIFNLGTGELKTLRATIERVCMEIDLEADLRFGELPYHPYEPMHLIADIRRSAELPWRPATNLAFAVWELAQSEFPALRVRRPQLSRCAG